MIKIGLNFDNLYADLGGGVCIIHSGEVIFKGCCCFSTKVSLIVYGGCIEIGCYCVVGCGSTIQSRKRVVIGDSCRIAQFVVILDTNIHFMRNVETGKIYSRDRETKIGNYCWVGMRSRLMKGSIIPDYSTVAAGSLVNKDMTIDTPLYPTFAGTPAKVVGAGKVRIFNIRQESIISEYFEENPEDPYFQDQIGLVDEVRGNFEQFNYKISK